MRKSLMAAASASALMACGGPVPGQLQSNPQPGSAGTTTIRLVDYALEPLSVSVPQGGAIRVVNAGKTPHNLAVKSSEGKAIAKTRDLQPGQQATMHVDFGAGTYVDYCGEPGHESLGMKGSLTVEQSPGAN
jgi:plastocyanin